MTTIFLWLLMIAAQRFEALLVGHASEGSGSSGRKIYAGTCTGDQSGSGAFSGATCQSGFASPAGEVRELALLVGNADGRKVYAQGECCTIASGRIGAYLAGHASAASGSGESGSGDLRKVYVGACCAPSQITNCFSADFGQGAVTARITAPDTNLPTANSAEKTVAFWVKARSLPADTRTLIRFGRFNVGLLTAGTIFVLPGLGSGGKKSSGITTDQWIHVVAIDTGSSADLYINGVQDAASQGGSSPQITELRIGGEPTSTAEFDGLMSDVRVYDRVLTAAEIGEIYNSGQGSCTNELASSLVGWWKLDDGTGSTAIDTKNGADGTLEDGATWAAESPLLCACEGSGSDSGADSCASVLLAGTTSAARITAPDTALPSGSTPRTLTFWFKLNSGSDPSLLLNMVNYGQHSGANQKCASVLLGGPSNPNKLIGQVTPAGESLVSSTTLSVGRWYFAALTYASGTAKLYLDSVLEDSGTGTDSGALSELRIGHEATANPAISGRISDVRVFNQELSAAQLAEVQQSCTNTIGSALRGWWKLNEGEGDVAADSIAGNDGTLGEDAIWSTEHPPTDCCGGSGSGVGTVTADGCCPDELLPSQVSFVGTSGIYDGVTLGIGEWITVLPDGSSIEFLGTFSGGWILRDFVISGTHNGLPVTVTKDLLIYCGYGEFSEGGGHVWGWRFNTRTRGSTGWAAAGCPGGVPTSSDLWQHNCRAAAYDPDDFHSPLTVGEGCDPVYIGGFTSGQPELNCIQFLASYVVVE
jgi:hypothetical protein